MATNIVYNLNLPNPPNDPSIDAPNLQTNTNSISSIISQDHIGFNTSTNASGIHNIINFYEQLADPAVGLFGQLYTKNLAGTPALFFEDTTGRVTRLTQTTALSGNQGIIILPLGLIMQFGNVSPPGNSGIVTFLLPFVNPPISVTFGLLIPGASSAHNVWIDGATLTNSGFDYKIDVTLSGVSQMYWMALGI